MSQPTFSGPVTLLTMPDDGAAPKALIDSAKASLRIKMFEFDSESLIEAVIAAKRRGVDVVVLLNPVRSSGARPNDATFARFRDAGIDVGWTSPRFKISHEKSMIIDGTRLLISTFNYSDKYLTKTRDYGVLLEDSAIIAEVAACFEADRRAEPFWLRQNSPLAWGNQDARCVLARFVDEVRHELWIQHPKFHDSAILDHVLEARDRGVKVHLLCGGDHGIEEDNLLETFSHQRILARAGVHLRRQRHLKLHAKMIIGDGHRAMVGSMNIDKDAFDVRRELGIVLDDRAAVKSLVATFEADWHEARKYEPPNPLNCDLRTIAIAAKDSDGIEHE